MLTYTHLLEHTGWKLSPCHCTSGCTATKTCLCKQQQRMCLPECHPTQACSNQLLEVHLPSISISDLGTTDVSTQESVVWVNIGSEDLLLEDMWLIQSGEWINDRVVSAWQFLLKQKYSTVGGLHSTVAVSNTRFKQQPLKHEFVQVLNSNNNHWVAISTIECSVGSVYWINSMHV